MKSFVYRYFQQQIAIYIAVFEGFFKEGSRARRNNNPGNLRGWSKRLPKDPGGFDIFPDLQAGVDALFRQVELNIDRELTVWEFFVGKIFVYAGYDASNPEAYARFIASRTGLPLDSHSIIAVIEHIEQQIDVKQAT